MWIEAPPEVMSIEATIPLEVKRREFLDRIEGVAVIILVRSERPQLLPQSIGKPGMIGNRRGTLKSKAWTKSRDQCGD